MFKFDGWMTTAAEKPESAGFGRLIEVQGEVQEAPAPAVDPVGRTDGKKFFTMEEIEKHNTEHDVWIIDHDQVYDCTEFLELRPGGADSILINACDDSTEEFVAIHSMKATSVL